MTSRVSPLGPERPFPGLRPFERSDYKYFFGREDQIYSLFRLVDRNRFVAVVGGSGSGKSSLVKAGLLPLMESEKAPGGGPLWYMTGMSPGDAPLSRLTSALSNLESDSPDSLKAVRRERIAFALRDSSHGIADALDEIAGIGKAPVLLVVDQFEELFRFVGSHRRNKVEEVSLRNEATHFVELLLRASRSRARKVHVLLTMRSDFTGDCARFQGLPEVVSGSQFLVPSLTRDNLEEVIRRPIAESGGSIDSALVETLLNDSGEEADQLPVLQHCLSRLWECAGTPGESVATNAAAEKDAVAPGDPPVRNLTLDHYDTIGRMSDALSLHADSLFDDLKREGCEVAVEQTFRALAEVDKEGRATRRVVKFSQLVAETGLPEDDLRRVVDRYRADDCSFLTPSLSVAPELTSDTRIDVGHEALLRRWIRVSGVPDAPPLGDDPESVKARGWLRAEESDGIEYKGLVTLAGDDTLPRKNFERRLKMWRSRPRTPAWAQRYGGKFDEVEQLFQNTIAARDRGKRYRIAGAFAGVALIVGLGFAAKSLIDARNAKIEYALSAERMKVENQKNYEIAANATRSLLATVWPSLRNQRIPSETACRLLATAESWIDEHSVGTKNDRLNALDAEISLIVSDIASVLGDDDKALNKARNAKASAMALPLTGAQQPPAYRNYIFRSAFRIGDVVVKTDKVAAQRDYQEAVDITRQLWKDYPDQFEYGGQLNFALNKVGEALELQGKLKEALDKYGEALTVALEIEEKNPGNSEWSRLRAATHTKIGKVLSTMTPPDFEGALAAFNNAILIQKVLAEDPVDNAPRSNLAISYKTKADLLAQRGDIANAIIGYRDAIEIWEALVRRDAADMRWYAHLAPAYDKYSDAVRATDRTAAEALRQKASEARRRRVTPIPCGGAGKQLPQG